MRKWLIKLAEKFLERYNEGILPPERFFDEVTLFDQNNEHATRYEWAMFSSKLMATAYRDGYIRGREYIERDPDEWWPNPRPEVIANKLMPGWDEPLNPVKRIPRMPVSQETETERVMRQLRELKNR